MIFSSGHNLINNKYLFRILEFNTPSIELYFATKSDVPAHANDQVSSNSYFITRNRKNYFFRYSAKFCSTASKTIFYFELMDEDILEEVWNDMKSANTKFSLVTKKFAYGFSYFLGFACSGQYDFKNLNVLASNYLSVLLDDGKGFYITLNLVASLSFDDYYQKVY